MVYDLQLLLPPPPNGIGRFPNWNSPRGSACCPPVTSGVYTSDSCAHCVRFRYTLFKIRKSTNLNANRISNDYSLNREYVHSAAHNCDKRSHCPATLQAATTRVNAPSPKPKNGLVLKICLYTCSAIVPPSPDQNG